MVWGAARGVQTPTPGTHAGLSLLCLSNLCWGLWKGPQLPCCPSAGLAGVNFRSQEVEGHGLCTPLRAVFPLLLGSTLDPPHSFTAHERGWEEAGQAYLLSPAAAPRSLLAAGGSSHEAFSAGQKASLRPPGMCPRDGAATVSLWAACVEITFINTVMCHTFLQQSKP